MSHLFTDDGPVANGQKVCLATTVYDNPDAAYTFSMARSREALSKAGIQSAYFLLSGNCHVDDARNSIVQEFLLSDCTELIFIDADVSWTPENLIELCRHDLDIVGGVYPYRREDSQKNGDMPIRMMEGAEVENGLIEVEGLPTGFMKIKRRVFERLCEDAEHFSKRGDNRSLIPLLFERSFKDGTRWGGDLNFCNKWRATGGKIYADHEMVLCHVGKAIIKDSLGSALRRRTGTTLSHIVGKIRRGTETIDDLTEAADHVANHWGAQEAGLAVSIGYARKAKGPIIEAGSGLTTILMAAATNQIVYCLEHHALYSAQLQNMAAEAGVTNIGLCECPIKDGWYDLDTMDLPKKFAFGLNDGPPRQLGPRMGFFDMFGRVCDVIVCDDADDPSYLEDITKYADKHNREITIVEPRTAVLLKPKKERKVA